ncbi:MAG TPA: sigma-70 family RNA polymerase sigma factor [Ramlibacter sp.]|nr:sigma-70 family RNA polymerase sigma factor [Ramlibacter sp.]
MIPVQPTHPDTHGAVQAYGLGLDTASTSPAPLEAAGGGERELWLRWRELRDPSAREALATLYVPYARALAAKTYSRRMHNEFEFDEYLHFGVVGMMEALDRYDPSRGAIFKTFATPRINGAILNGLEGLSERQQQIGMRRRLTQERVQSMKESGLSDDRGERLLRELSEIGIGLALGFLLDGTGMLAESEGHLPDNAYAHIEMRELRERIWQLVEQATPREAQVIRRHYLQQQSFDDIATALQLTKGRISQLHRQALERLRKLMGESRADVAW